MRERVRTLVRSSAVVGRRSSPRSRGLLRLPGGSRFAGVGLALALATTFDTSRLARGGVASVWWVLLLVWVFGVPLAVDAAVRRAELAPEHRAGFRMLELTIVLFTLAAIVAEEVRGFGPAGIALAGIPWLVGGLCATSSRVRLLLVGGAVLGGLGWGLDRVLLGSPWPLLEPRWDTAGDWWYAVVPFSILCCGFGTGTGSVSVTGPRTGRREAWGTAGVAIVAVAVVAMARAAAWEVGADSWWHHVAIGFALLAGCHQMASSSDDIRMRSVSSSVGFLASLWLAGPGWMGIRLWWTTLLPLALGAHLLLRSVGAPPPVRYRAWIACGVLVVAAVSAWPGIPPEPLAAASMASMVVVFGWMVVTPWVAR